ncbi:MAG: ABC transporter ATP-binding protein [Burkholderiaceae bacterium]
MSPPPDRPREDSLPLSGTARGAQGASINAALELQDISAWYGSACIISNASLSVAAGEVVALIGRNGAGKTSLLRSAIGLMPRCTGRVFIKGNDVSGLPPFRRAQLGLGYVPEDRRIFTDLTVAENLRIAGRPLDGGFTESDLLELFPNLADMLHRPAGAMSGGEQQMLAVARTLAANPSVVLLDEPSEGIAPLVVAKMREAVVAMKSRGVATLVSEQNVRFAAAISDRAVLIELGKVVGEATRAELLAPSEAVQRVLALGATAPTI